MGEWESACLQHGIHVGYLLTVVGSMAKMTLTPSRSQWPLAFLASAPLSEHGFLSAFAEHGFTWHRLLYMKVLL